MHSVKCGGLSRGRGMSDNVISSWCLTMHRLAQCIERHQHRTHTEHQHQTSEQHVEERIGGID